MTDVDRATLVLVWGKGQIVPGYDPNMYRKDVCGAWIQWSHYGDRYSDTGWEVDHILPSSRGGSDNLINLRPLHWKNNAKKSDGSLVCVISAS